ncbi:MAG: energy-coupling factor transporter transmembrane component T family protein [Candidatus Aphodocola sp.]
MNKYPFFKYVTGDSKMHVMNSKMKIIWFLAMLLCTLIYRDYVSAIILTLLFIFFMASSKISLKAYLSNIFLIWPIYIITFIICYLVTSNILFSILIVIKVIMLVLLFIILTFTTSLSEIAWGFECAFVKLKKIGIPVSKISLKIAMNIKFISTLFEKFKEVRKSMAYRGIPYKNGSFKAFRKMIIPVFSLSYKLSRRMGKIMKLRFYGLSKKRTNYHENKTTKFDKILVISSFILLYIVIWLGWC